MNASRPLQSHHADGDRPQDYRDLVRLVTTLQQAAPHDSERQGVRDYLLAKLTALLETPTQVRGGVRFA